MFPNGSPHHVVGLGPPQLFTVIPIASGEHMQLRHNRGSQPQPVTIVMGSTAEVRIRVRVTYAKDALGYKSWDMRSLREL